MALTISLYARGDVAYRTELTGDLSGKMARQIRSLSELYRLERRVPASMFQLEQRADRDVANLTDYLKNEGYYDASVQYEIIPEEGSTSVRVQLRVQPGARYTVESILIDSGGVLADSLPSIPAR
ncbi:MAG TPA: POTRA domain-containing protein, partial [Candidatus Hydrogenedentes bacterium]|nr:POTRA domain-containing protein [Candidatus Hydrogenedentota bacterium]